MTIVEYAFLLLFESIIRFGAHIQAGISSGSCSLSHLCLLIAQWVV